eukprot:2917578-Lingulodinium_polyedra.AAC.1
MSVGAVVQKIKLLAKTGIALETEQQVHEMQVLLESLKEVLVEKSGSSLEVVGQRPILLSYSNDGAP